MEGDQVQKSFKLNMQTLTVVTSDKIKTKDNI